LEKENLLPLPGFEPLNIPLILNYDIPVSVFEVGDKIFKISDADGRLPLNSLLVFVP
jgi:hypothetical protein